MEILFKDSSIIVCIKPAGLLSEGESPDAMPVVLSRMLEEQGTPDISIFPVHRLDRDTSGVMVFATSAKSAAVLSESIRNKRFKKRYLAVTHGIPSKDSDTLSDLLFFDRKRSKSFIVDRERKGVKSALLDYRVISVSGDRALLMIDLHTGRTHQIRAQLSSRGLPLVGDRRYGAPQSDARTPALLSYSLSFEHPVTKKALSFFATVPDSAPWSDFDISDIVRA